MKGAPESENFSGKRLIIQPRVEGGLLGVCLWPGRAAFGVSEWPGGGGRREGWSASGSVGCWGQFRAGGWMRVRSSIIEIK